MDMLRITGLRKRFGDKVVLDGLDMAVPEHSIFGFIGKNGAGKTTAMKIMLGLIKADAGDVAVNGEKVIFGSAATNRYIGYLPDVPEFYPFMTAYEYLRFCGGISGMSKADIDARSRELLELVGLQGEKHRIKGFSRGMKQRLGIAQALLNRPKLLVCDEPTSALDPIGRREMLELLTRVRMQTTVLFSTHILSDVERICTDAAFLDNGKAELHGKLSDIRSRYGGDEYLLETEDEKGALSLMRAFPGIETAGDNLLRLRGDKAGIFDVMRFAADSRILILKFEKAEKTLETLFMEVAGK